MSSKRRSQLFPPLKENPLAPLHMKLDDIPVVNYKIQGGAKAYSELIRLILKRLVLIASVVIGPFQVPVAPLDNPNKDHKNSHFIVRMSSDDHPEYCVDILVKDTDLYVVGFRRSLNEQWGKWHCFDDEPGPTFLEATKLGFKCTHLGKASTTPGGIPVILQVFETLAKYEDSNPEEKKRTSQERTKHRDLQLRVRKALFIIVVMFSEATRFRCIYLEIFDRIETWATSSQLDASMWDLINSWGHWSKEVLKLWCTDPDFSNSMTKKLDIDPNKQNQSIEVRFHPNSTARKIETIADLIGRDGQLTFMNRSPDNMISDSDLAAKWKKFGADIRNPKFEEPEGKGEESKEGEKEASQS